MRLTQYTDYALRTLIYLGVSPGGRHTIRDIAEAYDVSRHHLTKVVQYLHKHGFVEATRGKGGGLALARPASDIVVGDVVRRMEPSTALVECFDKGGQCAIQGHCKLTRALREAFNAFIAALDEYTLADLLDEREDRLRHVLGIPAVMVSD
ncbi:MAG: Rrf2 family transcriptional regulator [Haliea sp.]|uniref:RrF2 family transcriptional regulator n=1 Tax=Haliea sp. TaxID=1932666 RepID=UPI000C45A51D|nr:Rrf2 family transcriptional regulator [Haliea sp.]MBM70702.1 Rrf2 family transcriptional regulator [Haliea sp.]|tara:strand:+ start:108810 stop:109262 length:453 start_codon:yes stop_codon:yes gene_type:complete